MRIKKIRLKNGYKRFHDLTIDLGEEPKRIIALVGANGCGKSSVLDGMLYHSNAYGKIGNKVTKDFNYHSLNKNPGYDFKNIEIEFQNGSFQQIIETRMKDGRAKSIFSLRSPYRYNSSLQVKQSMAVTELRLNSYGAGSTADLDDKMEESYRRLYIEYNNYLNQTDCRPSEAKTKIIGDLNLSLKNCLDLEISSLGNIEADQGTLYFKKIDHPSEFDFNVLSSGEKEVVDILIDLYLRRVEYHDSIFLIDEPELHINTSIQKKLLLEINKLVSDDCQIWLTTHSIGFLRALQDELKNDCQVIFFKPKTNWAASSQVLLPIENNRKNWQQIFETALDDLTGLVSPKSIIYCEGKDSPGKAGEEKGLDAKVFNLIFGEKFHDKLFVSSGGNTELDQRSSIAIAILGKVFVDLEILILKDRDIGSGKLVTEKDRQLHLTNNPKNHRVLNRWEIENYLFDKEVLKKFCATNSLEFKEAEYDAFVTDIVNQNIKDEAGRIKNFCSIVTAINPEIFKIQLAQLITPDLRIYMELQNCIFERK